MTDEAPKNVTDLLDGYVKAFGDSLVANLSQPDQLRPIETISTGCLAIDLATEKGGIPRGRFTEIYGPEGGGKSTLMASCAAAVQKAGGKVLYVDMENKADDYYIRDCIKANGVEPESVWIVKPPLGTVALDIVRDALKIKDRTEQLDLIVIDSIAALVTQVEVDADAGDQHWAIGARLLTQNLRAIIPLSGLTKTALVGINQVRANMSPYGSPYTTSGGWKRKHDASLRLFVRRAGSYITEGKKKVGITCKCTVKKNAIGVPDNEVEFEILFGLGVDPIKDLITVAPEVGVMEKSGGWLKYRWDSDAREAVGEGGFNINGPRSTMEHLRGEPGLEAQIRAEVLQAIKR